MQIFDLCAGIGSFSYAAKKVMGGQFYSTVACAEIDGFCNKVLAKHGYEIVGDLTNIGVPEALHPHADLIAQDLVPVEETGFTSITMEDYLEGIIECHMVIAGSPCQDVSPANTDGAQGIDGEKSKVIHEVMRVVEDFDPDYVLLENSALLIRRGLHVILKVLNDLDYIIEWQTISAANFGYNHYRHRCFVVAYKRETAAYQSGTRIFKQVAAYADSMPGEKYPLPCNMTQEQLAFTRVADTRSIPLRTKRINALGNTVITDISFAILDVIAKLETDKAPGRPGKRRDEQLLGHVTSGGICRKLNLSLFDERSDDEWIKVLPESGVVLDGVVYQWQRDFRLNPLNTTYKQMQSTIVCRDGNNNYSTRSRANRPGKLGGAVGDLMKAGNFTDGGLNPIYAEIELGFPQHYTDLHHHETSDHGHTP